MSIAGCFWAVLVMGSFLLDNAWGQLASTYIDCTAPHPYPYPAICEGYEGILELVKTPLDTHLTLESPSCPVCLSFLNLSLDTPGKGQATVSTQKALDAEALTEYNGIFSYSILCDTGVRNNRTMALKDINDNAPVFEKSVYEVKVSKFSAVGSVVVQVKAIDADISPQFNTVSYCIEPPSDTFVVASDGSVQLKTELNHAVTFYTFNVTAKDIDNKSNTTVVNVTVIDGPRFEYEVYRASVNNNKVGPIKNIDPGPIKADAGNKYSVFYNISAVDPSEYASHFVMNNKSAIISIQRKLSEERVSTVNLDIQASLENGSGQKANATVILNVENGPEVDNNPPVFSLQVYTKEIYSVLPVGYPVLEVKATDPDVGETEALQYSLGEPSSLFDIEPSSGQVYVASDIHPGNVTLIVKATDLQGESGTATVEIIVKESGEHNIARMALNKPYAMVEEKCTSIEDALGRAMAWEVHVVKITAHQNKQMETEKELSERSAFQTDIHFIAIGSEIMHKDDVKRMVEREKERVLEELRPVLGPDVDLDMVDETPWRKFIIQVLLGTLAGMVVLSVTSIGVMLIKRRKRDGRRGSQDSMDAMPPFRRGSQDSMDAMPPFYISSPPTQANMHNNMHARMEFQHGPYQMSPYGRSYR